MTNGFPPSQRQGTTPTRNGVEEALMTAILQFVAKRRSFAAKERFITQNRQRVAIDHSLGSSGSRCRAP
jgi:hypothetical protein